MIEIFILWLIGRDISYLAEEKSEPKSKWVILTIVVWLITEAASFCLSYFWFGLAVTHGILIALAMAVITHMVIRLKLRNLPDKDQSLQTLIEQIGDEAHAGPSPQP